MNGQRHFTDWVLWDHPYNPRYTSVEYTNYSLKKFQYISGGFFLAKKQFILDNPFNENMSVGSAEDVEWSLRIRNTAKIVCNPTALVIHNKQHRDWGRVGFPFTQPTHSDIGTYKRMIGYVE
jgi:GT2 family glycosyltransferase